jgi:carboxymethylenebutenolidase
MPGELIEYKANGERARGWLSRPVSGKGPGLLVIQEWWGLVDHIKDVADRFAAEGFVALAPDLYHGETTRSPDEAGKLYMALNIAHAGTELRGAATHLLSLPAVSPKKIGALGFCMGGQLALYAAMQFPADFACAVDFYGVHPKCALDPARLKVPVQGHFATRDTSVPEPRARALIDDINAAGGAAEGFYYDAVHAFFNDTRPQVYSKADAALAWTRTLAFLRTHLA